jgi:hypothetical protein
MTGLKESVVAKVRTLAYEYGMGGEEVGVVVEELEKHIDDYSKELEEHMVLPELARMTADDLYRMYLQGYDFATTKMLECLKGEAVK